MILASGLSKEQAGRLKKHWATFRVKVEKEGVQRGTHKRNLR